MARHLPQFRVFIASPRDVEEERRIAEQIIDTKLPNDPFLGERCSIKAISWTKGAGPAMLATMDPQAAVEAGMPQPSECDIVIVILWARMGTRLPHPKYQKSDGSPFLSGTEYEFENAMSKARKGEGPIVLMYRRHGSPQIPLDDPDITEKTKQWEAVEGFFAQLQDENAKPIPGGVNYYSDPEDFREKLEQHLRQWLNKLLEDDRFPQSPPLPSEKESVTGEDTTENVSHAEPAIVPRGNFNGDKTSYPLNGFLLQLQAQSDGLVGYYQWETLPSYYREDLEFRTDETRQAFIERFGELQSCENIRGIRVVGRPGVGKSRLVLETIRQHKLEALTLYAFSPSDLPQNLFRSIAMTDLEQIVLVVDNCEYSDSLRLWQLARPASEKLQLVVIETDSSFGALAPHPPAVVVAPLSDENFRKFVFDAYKIHGLSAHNDDKAINIDDFTGGDLKLAITLISVLQRNPDIEGWAELTETGEIKSLLRRYLPAGNDALRTLQGLSLFRGTGEAYDTDQKAQFAAEFMGVGYPEFQQSAEELYAGGRLADASWHWSSNPVWNRRRIVTPHLLAVHLSAQVWRARRNEILAICSPSDEQQTPDVRMALLSSLGDIGDSKLARPVVSSLLAQFNSFEDIVADTSTFALLGEADPELTLQQLNKLTRDVSLDELRNFKEGRRSMISLLDNLLRLETTFWSSARLLARLAAAENETYGNNATGIWKSIFLIRLGGVPIPAAERLQLVEELLNSENPAMRLVAIDALESTLSNIEHARPISGPRGYITPQVWFPENWDEFWSIRRTALELLDRALLDNNEDVAEKARACLLRSARAQIIVLTDEILVRLEKLPKTDLYRLEVWKTLHAALRFEGEHLSDEKKQSIEALAQSVITDSYHDRLLIYVKDVDPVLRSETKDIHEFQRFLSEKIEALAEEGNANSALLREELEWLTGLQAGYLSQIHNFMRELGRLDNTHMWLEDLVSLSVRNDNWAIIEAYLLGRIDSNDLGWVRKQVLTWAESDEGMARVVLSITALTDNSDDGVALIKSLLNKGWLKAEDVGLHRHWVQRISLDGVCLLLPKMLAEHSPETTYAGLSFVFSRLEKHPDESKALAEYVIPLMKRSAGEWTSRGLFSWEWEQLANLYVDTYPVEIADAAFTVFGLSKPFYSYHSDGIWEIVRKALEQDPEAVWSTLIERTRLPEDNPRHIPMYCLRNLEASSPATADILLEWASQSQPRGPEVLAEMAFTGGKFLNYLARELIIRFPESDNVREALKDKFLDLGVYSTDEYTDLLNSLRDRAFEWLHDKDADVRKWVQDVIDEIDRRLLDRAYE